MNNTQKLISANQYEPEPKDLENGLEKESIETHDPISESSEMESVDDFSELKSIVDSLSIEERQELEEVSLKYTNKDLLPPITLDVDGSFEVPEITGHKEIDYLLIISKLTKVYGLKHPDLGKFLSNQLRSILVAKGSGSQLNQVLAMISEIKPTDGIEAMLANQMVCIHLLTMDSAKRALHSDQTIDGQTLYLREVNKLSRTFTAQVEALNRHRGKGQQKMTVEHVQVNQGGQAIIGSVRERKAQNVDTGASDRGNEKNPE